MDFRMTDPRATSPTASVNRRRRPAALVSGSIALHAAAVAVLAVRPSLWPWAAAGVFADHALLTAVGLWPRSRLLGPNWTRLPDIEGNAGRIAITIDDGPDPRVTPAVLDILAAHNAHATFFCIGERIVEFAPIARDIIRRGHAIENHTQRHLHRFSVLGPRAISREILEAQDTIAQVTGETPRFFRAPAGLRNPFLDPILSRNALTLASWTRRGFDTVTKDPHVVLDRLCADLGARDIVLLHDGHAARSAAGIPIILEVLPQLLSRIGAAGLATTTLRCA
jgi:peptidoglycan/xylan/chitin deacetylase (PgdA/CDA1 family)